MKDHFLGRAGSAAFADAAEERRETVVVLLAPFLKGMVVALRALEPHAEKQLRGIFQLRGRVVHLSIPGHRRIVFDLTRSGNDFADKLVVGFVLKQAVANPPVKGVGPVGVRGGGGA